MPVLMSREVGKVALDALRHDVRANGYAVEVLDGAAHRARAGLRDESGVRELTDVKLTSVSGAPISSASCTGLASPATEGAQEPDAQRGGERFAMT